MAAKETHRTLIPSMSTHGNPPQKSFSAFILAGVIIVIFVGCYYARHWIQKSPDGKTTSTQQAADYQRIIALAPSIAEIIYQLDLEERLVGVSRFCNHPPEVKKKPVVGGYTDLNFEAVLSLQPDCVVLLVEQKPLANKLESMGIHTIAIDHASTQGITDSISTLGKAFHKESQAQAIVDTIHQRTRQITQQQPSKNKPRVLVCIDRDTSTDHPHRVFVAGNKGVHQEYITMAGGVNAYQGSVAYPLLSREKLIHLDPDIIIELIREDIWKQQGHAKLIHQWQTFGELSAVKNKRVFFLHENQHMIPGPRWVNTLEKFHQLIHPTP